MYTVVARCSLDHHVEELIPVRRLVPAELHRQPLYVLNQHALQILLAHKLLLDGVQVHLDQTLLHQVVQLVAPQLAPQTLVQPFQVLHLPALLRLGFEHIWVEKAANLLVVVLETLKDKQSGNVQEDLGVPLLQLLRKLFVLFGSGFDDLAEVKQLVQLFAVQEVGQSLRPRVFEFNQDLH